MNSLNTNFLGMELQNPTVLASGICGVTGEILCEAGRKGAGAVTSKSVSLHERKGHRNPTIVEVQGGLLNAIGLSNPGFDEAKKDLQFALKNSSSPVFLSIFAKSMEEFEEIASLIAELNPPLIEADISCPNVDKEAGLPYAASPETAGKVTEIIKNSVGRIPVSIKLSPNVASIAQIAKAVEDAGANSITAINTAQGMSIDLTTKMPILKNKVGGLSGPALKPIAVRCVYQVFEAVEIPIIGTGGIMTGEDLIEYSLAGASLMGIGTAIYFKGLNVFKQVCEEAENWLKENGYSSLKELKGKAHEKIVIK